MNAAEAHAALEAAYRDNRRRVLATLIKLLGSFEAAEEALHEAFVAAAERWPRQGVPANPYAWLVSVGRFKTIDRWRAEARLTDALPDLVVLAGSAAREVVPGHIHDDELRLIFTCCHPILTPEARVALTLRELCGLTTEEIARAYLVRAPVVAQRIVRAKARIKEASIPYAVPEPAEMRPRLSGVLRVIYLIFNEGYLATSGPDLVRTGLCEQAIRMGWLLIDLLVDPEIPGLLALMLLHAARQATRVDSLGDIVLLEDQDRSLWNRDRIAQSVDLVDRALKAPTIGPYGLQAAIAAVHAQAKSFGDTNWEQIIALYDRLAQVDPSPVVALNRAVAIGIRSGPARGLAEVESVLASGTLDAYHLAHSTRADLLRRLGRAEAARGPYERALELTNQPAERRLLQRRLDQCGGASRS